MRRSSIFAAAGACLAMLGCGGQATSDATGGSGGTGAHAGAGGSSVGGGGTGASGGTGGSSGACAEVPFNAPNVGFESSPSVSSAVVSGFADGLQLSLGPDGPSITFNWVGPSLDQAFQQGEMVGIGQKDGWSYVSGNAFVASARRDYGFVAPTEIPSPPFFGPALSYTAQCSFQEAQGGCGQPPGTVKVLALSATTGAAPVTIEVGQTGSIVGWQIHNATSVQYPGYASEGCVVEAGFASAITALGPSLDKAGG